MEGSFVEKSIEVFHVDVRLSKDSSKIKSEITPKELLEMAFSDKENIKNVISIILIGKDSKDAISLNDNVMEKASQMLESIKVQFQMETLKHIEPKTSCKKTKSSIKFKFYLSFI